jgi:hypothetical protein
MKEPSKEQIKERAKFLREVLREKHKIDLPHGHALEVLAKVFGYKDWNTASALSAEVSGEKPAIDKSVAKTSNEKPIAAKLQTAGVLADFFASFDRDTNVVVNEYKDVVPESNNPKSISDFMAGTMTSLCSLTYDSEIQNGAELCLELNTEAERNFQLQNFGKSSNQTFERTEAGRSQRRIKYLELIKSSIWNPRVAARSDGNLS